VFEAGRWLTRLNENGLREWQTADWQCGGMTGPLHNPFGFWILGF
jgi:hypothetical protein